MKLTEITIIETVADYFNIELSDLRSQNREAGIVKARHLAFYFCRENTKLSYSEIGALLGRDHASVMHAVKSVNNQSDTDSKYRNQVSRLKEMLVGVTDKDQDYEYYMENDCYMEPTPVAEIKPIKIEPVKIIDKESVYVSPFAGKEFKSHNYAGYVEHQTI